MEKNWRWKGKGKGKGKGTGKGKGKRKGEKGKGKERGKATGKRRSKGKTHDKEKSGFPTRNKLVLILNYCSFGDLRFLLFLVF